MRTLLLVLPLGFGLAAPGLALERPPNVVLVYADDMGYGDLGVQNPDSKIPTPNLDLLYEQGMRFDHVHAEGLCAPTRYTVMTGNYTFRCHLPWGVWGSAEKPAVQPGQKTIGNVMQEAGYKTAFFGKWHLGGQWYRQGSDKIYDGPAFGKEADQIDAARGIAGGGPIRPARPTASTTTPTTTGLLFDI